MLDRRTLGWLVLAGYGLVAVAIVAALVLTAGWHVAPSVVAAGCVVAVLQCVAGAAFLLPVPAALVFYAAVGMMIAIGSLFS